MSVRRDTGQEAQDPNLQFWITGSPSSLGLIFVSTAFLGSTQGLSVLIRNRGFAGMANEVASNRLSQSPFLVRCPNCATSCLEQELAIHGYRCAQCGLEQAHLIPSPLGTTQSVLAWLRQPGEILLGRYRILRVLGKGGFAATYLVEDRQLNLKKRAIKEIPAAFYEETETNLLTHLDHPAIPDIIDRLHDADMVYLVLEFGGGRTLESVRQQRGGRISLPVMVPWMRQLGDVLAFLHGRTPPIIHRDLKPENILLDDQDRIRLIDFGLAKQVIQNGRTHTLGRAATQGFSPPEQALGTGTDPRSDVYALAATAYTLLTGQTPTPAHQRVAGMELPPPQHWVPDLPEQMNTALVQALNLNLNLRPDSVTQFLERAGIGLPPPAQSNPLIAPTERLGDFSQELFHKATSGPIQAERPWTPATHPRPRAPRIAIWVGSGLFLVLLGIGLGSYEDRLRALFAEPPHQVPTVSSLVEPEPNTQQPITSPPVSSYLQQGIYPPWTNTRSEPGPLPSITESAPPVTVPSPSPGVTQGIPSTPAITVTGEGGSSGTDVSPGVVPSESDAVAPLPPKTAPAPVDTDESVPKSKTAAPRRPPRAADERGWEATHEGSRYWR